MPAEGREGRRHMVTGKVYTGRGPAGASHRGEGTPAEGKGRGSAGK